MGRDQLSRQWQILRQIEVSKNVLKKALAQYEGTMHVYLRPQARKSRSDYFS